MLRSKAFITAYFFFIFIALSGTSMSDGLPSDNIRILILNSYHYGYDWSDDIVEGVQHTIKSSRPNAFIHVEYMDSKRLQDRPSERLVELYKHKFGRTEFDVIITSDDPAFQFMLRSRDVLFPDTPMVFCGVHNFTDDMLEDQRQITGIIESIDLKSTIDAAIAIDPSVKNVFIISDRTITGKMHMEHFLAVAPSYRHIEMKIFDDLSMDKLLDSVSRVSPDSFVLFLSFYKDKDGNVYSLKHSLGKIVNASPVPVYSAWGYMLGKGITGGKLISGFRQGEVAAKMALRFISGDPLHDLPIVVDSPNQFMFDHSQMVRFGIRKSALPAGSLLINEPPSIYSNYRWTINGVIGLIMLLSLVVIVLLNNIRKRRYAEAKLQETLDGLEHRIVERTEALAEANRSLHREIAERHEVEAKLHIKSDQLERLNKTLEEAVREEIESRRQQEQILIQQSKLAAMGEMVGAIAHQWRQPLSALGSVIQNIYDAHLFDQLDGEYLERSVSRSIEQINFMSKTIDDFRNFFTFEKEKTTFDVKFAIGEILSLLDAQLKNNYISYRLTCHSHHVSVRECADLIRCDDMITTTYKNEFEQVVLNLIGNAKDAIIAQRDKGALPSDAHGMIDFGFFQEDGHIIIRIADNGGGIPENIMHRIFEPYFTTKEQGMGTGIGLYMSKIIIEQSMGGKLYADNYNGGALFTILLKKENKHDEQG